MIEFTVRPYVPVRPGAIRECMTTVRYRILCYRSDGKSDYAYTNCKEYAALVVTQKGCNAIRYCELHGRAEIARLTTEVMEEEGKTENETVENNGAA